MARENETLFNLLEWTNPIIWQEQTAAALGKKCRNLRTDYFEKKMLIAKKEILFIVERTFQSTYVFASQRFTRCHKEILYL